VTNGEIGAKVLTIVDAITQEEKMSGREAELLGVCADLVCNLLQNINTIAAASKQRQPICWSNQQGQRILIPHDEDPNAMSSLVGGGPWRIGV
jgi:hypothetical protein